LPIFSNNNLWAINPRYLYLKIKAIFKNKSNFAAILDLSAKERTGNQVSR